MVTTVWLLFLMALIRHFVCFVDGLLLMQLFLSWIVERSSGRIKQKETGSAVFRFMKC